MRPLHKELARASLRLGAGNAGLWHDKFCDLWTAASKGWQIENGKKLEWIQTFTSKPIGNVQLLQESTKRLCRLSVSRGGEFGVFKTESRFVTGLGRSHPLENGFAWHPTLGVPYLPGSSIKGMIRAWATLDAAPAPSADRVNQLLGAPGDLGVGNVIFLDTVPVEGVQLGADVLTPHYAGWEPNKAPADWSSPVPVPFLVTSRDTPFLFAVLPRDGASTRDVAEVFQWLRDALAVAGAGAKTAVGYGRFEYDEIRSREWKIIVDDDARARAEVARRTEALQTPTGRFSLELEPLSEEKILGLVRVRLEKEPIADLEARRAFAQAVLATGRVDAWARGEKGPSVSAGPGRLKELAKAVRRAASHE